MPLSGPRVDELVRAKNTQYPAATKQAAAIIDGVLTNATSMFFTDKIMINISQDGRLAQWIHVPLATVGPEFIEQPLPSDESGDSLLPLSQLTPHTLLGGSTPEREIIGQLYATQIASLILTRKPDERRMVLLGLGLIKSEMNRFAFYDIIDLVRQCL